MENTYKCCTLDADGIIRQWALPDQSEDCECIHYKSQLCALYCCGIMHKTCFLINLNHLAPKDDSNHCDSVMLRKWNDQHSCRLLTCKEMDGTFEFRYFHITLCI
jgi:hypothetical protein